MRREGDISRVLAAVILGVAASGFLLMAASLFRHGKETEGIAAALLALFPGVLTVVCVRHVWHYWGRPIRPEPLPDWQPRFSAGASQSAASTDWVTVLESSNPLEIQVAKDALARNGIPVDVFDEHASSILGSFPSIPTRVVVPTAFAEQAAKVLRAFSDSEC